MITFPIPPAPQGAPPGRDVPAGGGFGEVLATLTADDAETAALADPGEGGDAPAGDGTGADEALLAAAAEHLADADDATRADELVVSRLGAMLADLGGRPGLQRRELLAALATAGLADASTDGTAPDAGDAGDALAEVADGETVAEGELAAVAGDVEEATPALLRALAAAADAATDEAAAADGAAADEAAAAEEAAAADGAAGEGDGETEGRVAAGAAASAAVTARAGAGDAAGSETGDVVDGAAAPGRASAAGGTGDGEGEASLEGADESASLPDVATVDDEGAATDEGEGVMTRDAGRAATRPATTSAATPTDRAEVGGGTTITAPEGPTSAPGTEASTRPAGSSVFVDRALEAAARLEHLAPPRQLTVELGEVRLRMALEDGVLRVQLLGDGAESGDERLLEDVRDELRARGFDLGDEHEGTNAGDGDRGADPRGEHAPAGGPSARARGRATTTTPTPHVPSRPTGLRL